MDEELEDDFDMGDTAEAPDPLDADNFNPVDYINKQFPNEVSLDGLPGFVNKLKAQQQQIDGDIRHAVRRQAATGRRARADLDEAKSAVRELFERIKAIKSKAEQSEALVSDVCRDIKSLDVAKRNLTLTVTALKRLVMLVTALEQLRTLAQCRQYEEASRLIKAIEELASHFQEMRHVARVADLLERKAAMFSDLKTQLLEDYASLHGPTHAIPPSLPAAACCVDAMGLFVRREVIKQFCLRLLEEYQEIFQPPKEASGLETAERRFHWLKRTLHTYDEKYGQHFPEFWRVPCVLCELFCHVTRPHFVEVLGMSHHTVDPELMVRVLQKSILFENELARKYPVELMTSSATAAPEDDYSGGASGFGFKYPDVLGGKANKASSGSGAMEDPMQFAPRFKGIISECFDAYLITWVQHEEKQLLEKLDRMTSAGADNIVNQDHEGDEEEDEGSDFRLLFASAPELFAEMKATKDKCGAFSTHQTLFDVFQVFRKVMAHYVSKLNSQMPLPNKVSTPLDSNAVQGVCCVIGTAEYCMDTLGQFRDALLRVIDSAFEDRVTFENEQNLLNDTETRALEVLMQSVNCSLDEAFNRMTSTPWGQYAQECSDHSTYVNEISDRLPRELGPISQYLSKLHYTSFCTKFVQAFITRFIAEIYRCRKISEQGAQQLLHDTSHIKTTLLEAPIVAVAGKMSSMPTAYSNYVVRKMGRAETMLKVLSTPHLDASSLRAMLGDDASSPDAFDVERLLALRASSDVDLGPVGSPRAEEDRGDSSGVAALRGLANNATNNAMSQVFSIGGAISQQHAKTSEDLKKLSGDMKKKLGGFQLPGMRRGSNV
mmetsp:Transcript_30765/g.56080  ORF Transcript_30765/g.56080 Transcript_30765/m.56080 type:complete len:833 (-) Transcript_30765:14-2512(-)